MYVALLSGSTFKLVLKTTTNDPNNRDKKDINLLEERIRRIWLGTRGLFQLFPDELYSNKSLESDTKNIRELLDGAEPAHNNSYPPQDEA